MEHRFETFRGNKTIVVAQSLKDTHLCMSFQLDFMSHQSLKIGCVNYALIFPQIRLYIQFHQVHINVHMHTYIYTCVIILYHFYCELHIHYLAGYMVAVKVLLYGVTNRLGKRIARKKSKSKI